MNPVSSQKVRFGGPKPKPMIVAQQKNQPGMEPAEDEVLKLSRPVAVEPKKPDGPTARREPSPKQLQTIKRVGFLTAALAFLPAPLWMTHVNREYHNSFATPAYEAQSNIAMARWHLEDEVKEQADGARGVDKAMKAFEGRLWQADQKLPADLKQIWTTQNTQQRQKMATEFMKRIMANLATLSADQQTKALMDLVSQADIKPQDAQQAERIIESVLNRRLDNKDQDGHVVASQNRYGEAVDEFMKVLRPYVKDPSDLDKIQAETHAGLAKLDQQSEMQAYWTNQMGMSLLMLMAAMPVSLLLGCLAQGITRSKQLRDEKGEAPQ